MICVWALSSFRSAKRGRRRPRLRPGRSAHERRLLLDTAQLEAAVAQLDDARRIDGTHHREGGSSRRIARTPELADLVHLEASHRGFLAAEVER